jgi:plasmid stabilization system protein ParE
MSDRTFELEVAENAQRDIIEIRLYSTEVWGDQQADDYLVRLSGASSVRSPVRRARSDRRTPCQGDASFVSMTAWGVRGTGQ